MGEHFESGSSASPHVARDAEALKNNFLASLNREIREPLSGILEMADLLLETRLDPEQKGYALTARGCARRLRDVLNARLDDSSLSCGSAVEVGESEFALRAVLEAGVAAHTGEAAAKDIALELSLHDNIPQTAIGHAGRLRRMVSQLVASAIECAAQGRIDVSACADRGWLTVRARNTGAVESTSQGSEFTARLRLRTATPVNRRARPEHSILLVDNNTASQTAMARSLAGGGFRVHCVASGDEAIEIAERILYDAVLMNFETLGMEGIETTVRLRELRGYRETPVLRITKPVQGADLIAQIERRLGQC